jgi:hypothetical protein
MHAYVIKRKPFQIPDSAAGVYLLLFRMAGSGRASAGRSHSLLRAAASGQRGSASGRRSLFPRLGRPLLLTCAHCQRGAEVLLHSGDQLRESYGLLDVWVRLVCECTTVLLRHACTQMDRLQLLAVLC